MTGKLIAYGSATLLGVSLGALIAFALIGSVTGILWSMGGLSLGAFGLVLTFITGGKE